MIYTAVDTWEINQKVYLSYDLNKLKHFMISKVKNRILNDIQKESMIEPTIDNIELDCDCIFNEAEFV